MFSFYVIIIRWKQLVPYNHVCANNKLWSGIPLMVRNVVVGLKPNPLLTFGKKSVVAGLSFAILHYCKNNKKTTEDHNIEHRKRLRNDDVCQLSANRGSLTVFVAFGQCLQIIYMVVVIA